MMMRGKEISVCVFYCFVVLRLLDDAGKYNYFTKNNRITTTVTLLLVHTKPIQTTNETSRTMQYNPAFLNTADFWTELEEKVKVSFLDFRNFKFFQKMLKSIDVNTNKLKKLELISKK